MPSAPDTLPISFKNGEEFGESEARSREVSGSCCPGARGATVVGPRLGSRRFVAGPPGLTVQLDHSMGPGCSRLRGRCTGHWAEGSVGLGANTADRCCGLGFAGRLATVHLVA